MVRRMSTSLLALLLSATVACATAGGNPDRMVTLDGQNVTAGDAAEQLWMRAQSQKRAGNVAAAQKTLEQLVADFGDLKSANRARLELANLYLTAGDADRAIAVLEPLGDAPDAVGLRGRAQAKRNATAAIDAAANSSANPAEQRAALEQLAADLLLQGDAKKAALALDRAIDVAESSTSRQTLTARLLDVVDSKLSFTDVRALLEGEVRAGGTLHELLSYKLVLVQMHLRDFQGASDSIGAYLTAYPTGQYVTDATALRDKLKARVAVSEGTVGVVLPLSGRYAPYGKRALIALQLGMGQKPKALPKGESRMEIPTSFGKVIVVDSVGDAKKARSIATSLVEQDHVQAIVGDLAIDAAYEIALVGEEYGVPVLSLSRRPNLPELSPWVFRLRLTTKKEAVSLAEMAMDGLGLKRFAILYPRHAYGTEMMTHFWDAVDARQGEVVAVESYAHDQTTFTEQAKKMVGRYYISSRWEYGKCKSNAKAIADAYRRKKALERCKDAVPPIVDFQALIVPDFAKKVSYVVPALVAEDMLVTQNKSVIHNYRKATGLKTRPVIMLGGRGWGMPVDVQTGAHLGERLDRDIDGALFVDGFDAKAGTKRVETFVKKFRKAARSKPQLMDAEAYDAGQLMWTLLSGDDSGKPTSRGALRDSLSRVDGFPGVTGDVRFDKNGDSKVPLHFFTFERGNLKPASDSQIGRKPKG